MIRIFLNTLLLSSMSFAIMAQEFLVVDENLDIYRVNPAECSAEFIVSVEYVDASITDIAIDPFNTNIVYAVFSNNAIGQIDLTTGATTILTIASFVLQPFTSLVYGAGGKLYCAGGLGTGLRTYSLMNNSWELVGDIPYSAGGDLTFLNGYLYLATLGGGLVKISLDPYMVEWIGFMPATIIYGIITVNTSSTCGSTDNYGLYALSSYGVYSIDHETAEGPVVCWSLDPQVSMFGAASYFETNESFEAPEISIIATKSVICPGETIMLNALNVEEFASYNWSTGEVSPTIEISPIEDVVISIEGLTGFGCSSDDELAITVSNLSLEVDILQPICGSSCQGQLSAVVDSDGFEYELNWSNGNEDLLNSNLCAGVYQCILTDENDCEVSSTIELNPTEIALNVSNDLVACPGEQLNITLEVSGDNPPFTFLSSNGEYVDEDFIITIEEDQNFSILVTDDAGCSIESEPIVIDVFETPEFSVDLITDTICEGECFSALINSAESFVNVNWYSNELGELGSNESICPKTTGEYALSATVIFSNGCSVNYENLQALNVVDSPELILSGDIDVKDDGSFNLVCIADTEESSIDQWSWVLNGVSIDNPSGEFNAVITEVGMQSISLTITNLNNCSAFQSLDFDIKPQELVFAPNFFTPNGDGINDTWSPVVRGNLTDRCSVAIYNRYGQLVFSEMRDSWIWTGGAQDYFSPDGVYSYIIKLENTMGAIRNISGHITIAR